MSEILFHGAHDFKPGGFIPNYTATAYQFTAPARIRLLRLDGSVDLMGYGIGEIIFAWEPTSEWCIARRKRREAIALCDGSWIIDPPKTLPCHRVSLKDIAGHVDVEAYPDDIALATIKRD